MLIDPFGRTLQSLRLSISAACPPKCLYRRAAAGGETVLTPGEIEALVRHLVERHGLRTVRLTGGEPAAREDLVEIVGRLAKVKGLDEVAMTTDGLSLARQAKTLAAAGLKRVNINLDSLDREKYERIMGVDGLPLALEGINAAVAAGLTPVKLNTTVIRGENDYELSELLLFAAWRGLEIRFAELTSAGPLARRWNELFVPESEMRQRLGDVVISWTARSDTGEPSRCYTAGMTYGRSALVGFVTSMTCPFCQTCTRLRIAHDGTIYPCMMERAMGSVLPALRPAYDATALDAALQSAISGKPRCHPAVKVIEKSEFAGM